MWGCGDYDGGFLWRCGGFFVGRRAEVEDGQPGLSDEAGEVVDAGAGTVGAAEDEEGLRAYVDCGEEGAPVLLEVASAKGEGVAVEDEGEAEVESAAVVGGSGGDEDGLPAGIGKRAELPFWKNAVDVGTGAADDTEGVARLHDGGSPEDVVGEGLSEDVDGRGGVAEDEPLGLTSGSLPLEVGYGAACMGMQAVAGPAFELGGVVAAEEMARAGRYEGAALQHNAAKIGDAIGDRMSNSRKGG